MAVPIAAALPTLARLYGCAEQDLGDLANELSQVWVVQGSSHATLGALGLRPSPAHGAELVGGAFPGPAQQEAATTLVRAALGMQPQLYAYAEAHLLPASSLEAAGLVVVAAYLRMSGPLPMLAPEVPDGYSILALSEVADMTLRLAAQQTYSDRIGHTHVTPASAEPNAGGSDDALSRIAFNAVGEAVGICRATFSGEQVSFGTPGVRPGARGTSLRRALTLAVCQAARVAGATWVVAEGWGDTEDEQAEDRALGLEIEVLTPIYSS
ncbi:hypothetical protein Q0M94_00250 [Deinococcus radiomollis]|uniref:hypothetical protein n=1 Tax=Deinococcus radiomollis TaxID=468916 RepID=UPI003891FEB7